MVTKLFGACPVPQPHEGPRPVDPLSFRAPECCISRRWSLLFSSFPPFLLSSFPLFLFFSFSLFNFQLSTFNFQLSTFNFGPSTSAKVTRPFPVNELEKE